MNILEPNQSGSADREAWRGGGEGGRGGLWFYEAIKVDGY